MYGEEVNGKLKINFQVITKSKLITDDKFLFFDNGTKVLENSNLLQFEDKTHFMLCETTNRIYFKKLSHLNTIHGDFKHLYKEASREDLNQIFTKDLESLVDINSDLISNNQVSSFNLKKIAFYKTNSTFEKIKENPDQFLGYIKKFDVLKELISEDKISIQSDKNMKIFLKACSEQVYQGDFTGDSFMANANKKI
jgi:ATP phosphoribosyltransferase regulatory subunit HisZ